MSTVSRIINNQGNFSDKTRRKVLELASEYLKPGITPPRMVGVAYRIAVFIPEVNDFYNNDPSISMDLNDLKAHFEAHGHHFQMVTRTAALTPSSAAYRMLNEKKIDAAVVFDPFVEDKLLDLLVNRGIPYLITNGRNYGATQNYIDYDNRKGAYDVIQYLYGLGHRHIGMIAGPSRHLVSENRLQGCHDAFCDLGLPWIESNVIMGAFDPAHGYQSVKKLLEVGSGITAIFAFNDVIAFGAMKGLMELGLRVPQNISVVGFDDVKLSEYTMPPLTTVRRFRYDINQLIVKMLSELISNRNISEVNISYKTELIERESCAKVFIKD